MKRVLVVLAAAAALLAAAGAQAAAEARLRAFLKAAAAVSGDFTQVVLDRSGKKVQESSGVLHMARPGRFRWEYRAPYEQLIVGDGQKVWVYDRDLNQVTVKRVADALGNTPAALLAGSQAVEEAFAFSEGGSSEGLDWVLATPKAKDSSFQRVRLGFSGAALKAMELVDSFGQTTLLRFGTLATAASARPELFTFVPPKGADVIGD